MAAAVVSDDGVWPRPSCVCAISCLHVFLRFEWPRPACVPVWMRECVDACGCVRMCVPSPACMCSCNLGGWGMPLLLAPRICTTLVPQSDAPLVPAYKRVMVLLKLAYWLWLITIWVAKWLVAVALEWRPSYNAKSLPSLLVACLLLAGSFNKPAAVGKT